MSEQELSSTREVHPSESSLRDGQAQAVAGLTVHSRSLPVKGFVAGAVVFVLAVLFMARNLTPDIWSRVSERLPSASVERPVVTAALQRGHAPAFDLSKLTVPRSEVRSGGPPKDGIPALTNPRFLTADAASDLHPHDRIIGVAFGDQARAYPLRILNYHEIVNDDVADIPIAVTYCPLCDSVAVFDRRTPLGKRDFGVSGLLYNSNVLMYDRGGDPESLWSQVMTRGISGPGVAQPLRALPVELTTWSHWRARYPHSLVLSPETGYPRDYNRSPYSTYFESPRLMFPAQPRSARLPVKERVLGVWSGNESRAYPESAFRGDRSRVEEEIAGKKFVIEFDAGTRSLRVTEADDGVQWMYSLWFAWYAFRPETTVLE